MKTVSLRGLDLTTSGLGFGTASLHHLPRHGARQALLAEAFESGIRYFDTAPLYGQGMAELELGTFLRTHRNDVVLATKFGIEPNALLRRFPLLLYARQAAGSIVRKIRKPAGPPSFHRDFTAKNAQLSLARSLAALQTDRIDILYLHEPDLSLLTEPDTLMTFVDKARRDGLIRFVGLSGRAADCIAIAKRHPSLAQVLQIDAAGDSELGRLREANLDLHVSFGHFRGPHVSIEAALNQARTENPHGVILFSSRRRERVPKMVQMIGDIDKLLVA